MVVKQSSTLTDHRPGVYDNGTPRRMFGPKREGVTGNWGKMHSKENHYLVDHLKNKIGGSCGSNGGAEGCMQLVVHGSVHRNINLTERTNKMQLCSRIYYSNVS
jgi:hypothetical protein